MATFTIVCAMLCVLVVFNVGLVSCQTQEDLEFCALFNPDEIVDDLMKGVQRELPATMALPRIDTVLTLHDGRVFHINSLVRAAKTTQQCTKDFMSLRVSLANSKVITGQYRWTKRLILSGRYISGVAKTRVNRMDLKLDIKVPFDGKPPGIKALDVDRFNGVDVKVYGLGIFSNFASQLATEMANRFKNQIVVIVERAIARIFTRDFQTRLMRP